MQNISLPERIEHLLPDEAEAMERAARAVMDHLYGHGFRLVTPPLVENTEALFSGEDDGSLGDRTLRLTDPLGGKLIGIRADITPQIRRIDANHFKTGIAKLCYCGPTLYSRPIKPWLNREQFQAGAEIFGGEPMATLTEIVMVALSAVAKAGIKDLALALGHAGIVHQILKPLEPEITSLVLRTLAKKDLTSMQEIVLDSQLQEYVKSLVQMHGTANELDSWEKQLPSSPIIQAAFEQLRDLTNLLTDVGIDYTLDLAGLTGYEYHNSVTFVILGGEKVLGRGGGYGTSERPACGFSVNIRDFITLLPSPEDKPTFASMRFFHDAKWRTKIDELITQGWRCILVDDWDQAVDVKKRLVDQHGSWHLTKD